MSQVDDIIEAARREVARERYIQLLAEETARLRLIAGRPWWRRAYDAVFPFTVTIRRNK